MRPIYRRRPSRTVFVGQVAIGGNNPIRVQSMITSDTKDTDGVVKEIEDLVSAGCEIVRLTVPTKADCANLKNIRTELAKRQIRVPLVADIHFTPSIAMDVVEFVEKVRINPGNFVDKKLFKVREYTDEQYGDELERIREKFVPLVEKCKQHGVAMRIGTNHGSLSDRILNRYGDTPEGMVESALEFLRIAAEFNYYDIILSMKASNTQVMIAAYRLLAQRLDEEGFDHPFHLGVTEAGEGEDGRIKSAVGIGTLLQEGIGDTIRVSLTEDAVNEIPVAQSLAAPFNYIMANANAPIENAANDNFNSVFFKNRYHGGYKRREVTSLSLGKHDMGNAEPVRVWTQVHNSADLHDLNEYKNFDPTFEGVEVQGHQQHLLNEINAIEMLSVDLAVCSNDLNVLNNNKDAAKLVLKVTTLSLLKELCNSWTTNRIQNQILELRLDSDAYDICSPDFIDALSKVNTHFNTLSNQIMFSVEGKNPHQSYRWISKCLDNLSWKAPLNLLINQGFEPISIEASRELGALLNDGFGDSIQINGQLPLEQKLKLSYGILQACRVRISKTEFIACPSCGRTLFDLQEVTQKIKARTDHLKGVKIAIMGCIVNGPGEMADADFGYVGTGVGKISLYVGKECVTRNIPEEKALDSLIDLIKEHGQWNEASDSAA